jgi:hypothetical protein
MDSMVDTLNRALQTLDSGLTAIPQREYSEKRSAGISIVEAETGGEIVGMDISVKPVSGSKVYQYGEIGIRGVLPTEILADKIVS